jgi:hypothetical protein
MACRGNYGEMYSSKTYDAASDYVCFWLVTPELKNSKKLHAILTLHDEDQNNSVSSSVDTRRINSSQKVSEFMHTETNHLIINAGMLEKIVNEDSLFLEVIIKESIL